jgi:hypothetical protein
MSKEKRFSCVHCGTPFKVYPPDDDHPLAYIEKPEDSKVSGSIIKMAYVCEKEHCHQPTTLYWYRRKMPVSHM